MRRVGSMRGAAIAETAVIVSFVLLLLFGTLEIIEVGYLQAAADGAVFLTAHEYALGNKNVQPYASPFPGVKVANITFSPAPPDDTQVPVDYGVNQGNARYGGVQMIRPQHLQAQYQSTFQGFLSGGALASLPVNGGAVEARYFMADRGFSVDGWAPNSSQTYSNMIDPLYQDDQNVPPYMIGMHDQLYCDALSLDAHFPAKCDYKDDLLAMGLAEYLDHDNYNTQPGNNGVLPGGTFYAMACHQRIFAQIAAALPAHFDGVANNGRNNDAPAQADPRYYENAPTHPNTVGAYSTGPWREAYDWDRIVDGSVPIGHPPGPYPLYPMANCP